MKIRLTKAKVKVSNLYEDELTNKLKTAVIIITYNKVPSFELLNTCLSYVDYIFITDNGSGEEVIEKLKNVESEFNHKIVLQLNRMNLGLSRSINVIVDQFKKYDVYWFYIFDQDSIVDYRFFLEAKEVWNSCLHNGEKIGLVVPIVGDQNSQLGQRLNIKRTVSTISSAITSGIFTNIEVFKEVGGFDESFFVYGADIDFTIKVRRKGYKICRLNKIYVVQTYGNLVKNDTLFSKLFFKLSKINSLFNLKLNMVNAYHSVPYGYKKDLLIIQFDTTRIINRKYNRILPEVYRLIQKYLSPLFRRWN